ncbi:hypothetical protein JJB46_06530 [Clostridium perfringens]|uniref:Transcription regulator YsiA C-terminal domain-containing protein n=1 Tax=Clostridium perfringens TaxID=1502 RepID=A0AAN5NCE6_CLOPF|nr:TetR/AcrR family transcriptional regulator C-terminal domain-containing protein [Clostridium perfringens]AQW26250.1 hypothetical protein BXT94_05495 [Clostridium perfringens]EIW6614067.1 hypothetical protein [Clostridium perfringens]KAB8118889.1 hypothetical protein FVB38_14480 [Clostridium perfringens]KQC93177.1 hypothetical protein AM596_05090 [Clostridium perfringens CP4]MBO3337244.1 hypothetical protein [Clostridium perfringens]
MKEKTIDEIHEEHMNDKNGRDTINDLYKKVYLKYISLIENYELDIREEMVFVESKLNKYNNELLNYYMNFFASILSGVCVAIITVFITSNDIKKLIFGFILLFLFVYLIIMKNSKYDIKEISNEKKYYSICLLVLNDLEEELL